MSPSSFPLDHVSPKHADQKWREYGETAARVNVAESDPLSGSPSDLPGTLADTVTFSRFVRGLRPRAVSLAVLGRRLSSAAPAEAGTTIPAPQLLGIVHAPHDPLAEVLAEDQELRLLAGIEDLAHVGDERLVLAPVGLVEGEDPLHGLGVIGVLHALAGQHLAEPGDALAAAAEVRLTGALPLLDPGNDLLVLLLGEAELVL